MVRVSTTAYPDAYTAPDDRLITGPFVVVTLSAFAFFMYIGTLVPLVPLFIEGPLAGGEFGLGLNAAVFAIAAVLARPALGRIADRYGRRSIIMGGALLAGAGGMLMSQADSLAVLLVLRSVTGVGEAAVFVGAATLIADLSPRGEIKGYDEIDAGNEREKIRIAMRVVAEISELGFKLE